MRRFLRIIGALLIVISVVFMLAFIILPVLIPSFDSIPPLKTTFQLLFCNSNETLVDSRTTSNPSPGTTVTTLHLGCVNNEHQTRDISSAPILIGLVGYLVPFLLGLFLVITSTTNKRAVPSARFFDSSQAAQAHWASSSAGTNIGEELSKLAELHKNGDLNDAQFEAAKRKLLD